MSEKMPCSITDGEQFEEYEARQEQDPDAAYDEDRQRRIDESDQLINFEISMLSIEIETLSQAKLLREILRIIKDGEK